MPHRLPWGWAAVDLFFVLSGYLITSIVLRFSQEKRFLYHFYMRRGLRIWPVYFLTILLMAAAVPFLPRPYVAAGLPFLLTYTQNIPLYWSERTPVFSSYLTHSWSLAIEEQFYLLWPPLVCLVGRRGIAPLAIAVVSASVWARMVGFDWWILLGRSDGLALGALLAAWPSIREGARYTMARWQIVFGAVSLAALVYLGVLAATGGIPLVIMPRWPSLTVLAANLLGFGIVGLVLGRLGSPALWPLRVRWLVGLGKISYGLYMYHFIVLCLSDDAAQWLGMRGRPFWRVALTTAVILGLAVISWRYLERPILELKNRFPYRPFEGSVPERLHQVGTIARPSRHGGLDGRRAKQDDREDPLYVDSHGAIP